LLVLSSVDRNDPVDSFVFVSASVVELAQTDTVGVDVTAARVALGELAG